MPSKKTAKVSKVSGKARAAQAVKFKERRKSDRRRGVIDAIYQRLVKRDILPDRRKGDRREGGRSAKRK